MTHYEIDNDQPMPEKRGRPVKYPFADLEVGQSFTARSEPMSRVTSSASYWSKKLGRKFTARRVENAITGVTVWRTE